MTQEIVLPNKRRVTLKESQYVFTIPEGIEVKAYWDIVCGEWVEFVTSEAAKKVAGTTTVAFVGKSRAGYPISATAAWNDDFHDSWNVGTKCCSYFSCANGKKIEADSERIRIGVQRAVSTILSKDHSSLLAKLDSHYENWIRKISGVKIFTGEVQKEIRTVQNSWNSLDKPRSRDKSFFDSNLVFNAEAQAIVTSTREKLIAAKECLEAVIEEQERQEKRQLKLIEDIEGQVNTIVCELFTKYPRHYFDTLVQECGTIPDDLPFLS